MTRNHGHTHKEQIEAKAAGQSVLAHLLSRGGPATEADWRARLDDGEVQLDEVRASPEQKLRAGQWLTWARPPWVEPAVPLCAAVLYEDADLLAVAKPRGLPTMPGGGEFLEHTLLNLVRRRRPGATPMHRLGRATSGLVLFARTADAGRQMQQAFRERRVRKLYRALCSGTPARDRFTIDAPIGEVPHPLLGTVHGASEEGKPSRSHVRVLERRDANPGIPGSAGQALVEVEIETGRPHQIRIHLAFAGHALCGDPLYGKGGLPFSVALPGDPGYFLHAYRLELPHPRTGEPLLIECAPPPALRTSEQSVGVFS